MAPTAPLNAPWTGRRSCFRPTRRWRSARRKKPQEVVPTTQGGPGGRPWRVAGAETGRRKGRARTLAARAAPLRQTHLELGMVLAGLAMAMARCRVAPRRRLKRELPEAWRTIGDS